MIGEERKGEGVKKTLEVIKGQKGLESTCHFNIQISMERYPLHSSLILRNPRSHKGSKRSRIHMSCHFNIQISMERYPLLPSLILEKLMFFVDSCTQSKYSVQVILKP